MSSTRDPNHPFGGGGGGGGGGRGRDGERDGGRYGDGDGDGEGEGDSDGPTHNKPWPRADVFMQGRFERKYLADGHTIDFDRLPTLQFWASWFGMPDFFPMFRVLQSVVTYSNAAKRPLTGIEAGAIAEHSVHSSRILAWVQPLSCVVVGAVAFSGRRTFKFPFYQPKRFDPFYFPSRRTPFLKGASAVAFWHVLRVAAYAPVVWIPTAITFSSIADKSFMAHMARDPRIAPLIEEGRRNQVAEQQPRRRAGVPNPARTGSTQNTQQPGNEAYQGDQPSSPEYGSPDYAPKPSITFGRPSSATESPQTAYPSSPRNTSTRPAPYRTQESASSSRREDDASGLFDDDNDDASPVAPSARRREVPSSSSGSSWDRIREQAKSGSPDWERGDSSGQERGWAQLRQDKSQNPKDSNPKTDSYSYSTDDEERERRNYEKEQAQKEFDALLEAERRGDESSSSSRRRR
ncbi:hypothetical protein F4859DRAFT_234526 [Xylaria cf. heliscus]|nr:hypothetical protein F4859DRAFT_234526 [Xylaria cf. heliscus]